MHNSAIYEALCSAFFSPSRSAEACKPVQATSASAHPCRHAHAAPAARAAFQVQLQRLLPCPHLSYIANSSRHHCYNQQLGSNKRYSTPPPTCSTTTSSASSQPRCRRSDVELSSGLPWSHASLPRRRDERPQWPKCLGRETTTEVEFGRLLWQIWILITT